MKSFKFTGVSVLRHRLADNPTCGEVQHFVLKRFRDLDRPKQTDK